eukprot:5631500-Prymnesium_polylepis.1
MAFRSRSSIQSIVLALCDTGTAPAQPAVPLTKLVTGMTPSMRRRTSWSSSSHISGQPTSTLSEFTAAGRTS